MDVLLDWPEITGLFLLFLGFWMAFLSDNVIIAYVVCFLMGAAFGRFWYKLRQTNRIQVFFSIVGFLTGFVLGSLFANIRALLLIFFAGLLVGFWIHKSGVLKVD